MKSSTAGGVLEVTEESGLMLRAVCMAARFSSLFSKLRAKGNIPVNITSAFLEALQCNVTAVHFQLESVRNVDWQLVGHHLLQNPRPLMGMNLSILNCDVSDTERFWVAIQRLFLFTSPLTILASHPTILSVLAGEYLPMLDPNRCLALPFMGSLRFLKLTNSLVRFELLRPIIGQCYMLETLSLSGSFQATSDMDGILDLLCKLSCPLVELDLSQNISFGNLEASGIQLSQISERSHMTLSIVNLSSHGLQKKQEAKTYRHQENHIRREHYYYFYEPYYNNPIDDSCDDSNQYDDNCGHHHNNFYHDCIDHSDNPNEPIDSFTNMGADLFKTENIMALEAACAALGPEFQEQSASLVNQAYEQANLMDSQSVICGADFMTDMLVDVPETSEDFGLDDVEMYGGAGPASLGGGGGNPGASISCKSGRRFKPTYFGFTNHTKVNPTKVDASDLRKMFREWFDEKNKEFSALENSLVEEERLKRDQNMVKQLIDQGTTWEALEFDSEVLFSCRISCDRFVLCTQFSMDRLSNFKRLVMSWGGPMSACLYLESKSEAQVVQVCKELEASSNLICIRLDAVVQEHKDEWYPINFLRNVAFLNARIVAPSVTHVLLLDADFIVSMDLYQDLREKY